jgi:probable rRNA maturation factor
LKVVVTNRHKALRVHRSEVERLVAALQAERESFEHSGSVLPSKNRERCTQSGAQASVLSVVFLSDSELAALHGRFLDDPSLTDVITFPPTPDSESAGEICISADAARRAAGARGFSRELTLYLVHGWLHLAGHDDLKSGLKRRMRRAERRALALLATKRAIPQFTWRSQ